MNTRRIFQIYVPIVLIIIGLLIIIFKIHQNIAIIPVNIPMLLGLRPNLTCEGFMSRVPFVYTRDINGKWRDDSALCGKCYNSSRVLLRSKFGSTVIYIGQEDINTALEAKQEIKNRKLDLVFAMMESDHELALIDIGAKNGKMT